MQNRTLINDYLTLCKPRVVALMLITAWVGMYLATQEMHWGPIIFGTIGIALAASSAAIINHFVDRRIDQKMQRTQQRPLASGKITPRNAMIFATTLAIVAAIILFKFVNTTAALLTFATLIGYAGVYTLYLKRATPQNIVIGGLSGAMPPLLGWSCITGTIDPRALLLVLIIFTWTPPHFWALAIYRADDYRLANIPMLPVTHGKKFTKVCLLLYTFLLLCACCLPFAVGMAGALYLSTALVLNTIFVILALRLLRSQGAPEHALAIKTFNFSILFLFLLFIMLLIDHGVG